MTETFPGSGQLSKHAPASGFKVVAESLGVRFGRRRVFQGVNFELVVGDCMVVQGPNGAGKSTLLRSLVGLQRLSEGRICYELQSRPALEIGSGGGSPEMLHRLVGVATPELELYPELTAAENLIFFSRLRGVSWNLRDSMEALDRVGLRSRAHDRIGEFSSGMRQRLRLLFATQHEPLLLLLDEPGSNLDAEGRQLVREFVDQQLKRGIVALATNDPEELDLGGLRLSLGCPR